MTWAGVGRRGGWGPGQPRVHGAMKRTSKHQRRHSSRRRRQQRRGPPPLPPKQLSGSPRLRPRADGPRRRPSCSPRTCKHTTTCPVWLRCPGGMRRGPPGQRQHCHSPEPTTSPPHLKSMPPTADEPRAHMAQAWCGQDHGPRGRSASVRPRQSRWYTAGLQGGGAKRNQAARVAAQATLAPPPAGRSRWVAAAPPRPLTKSRTPPARRRPSCRGNKVECSSHVVGRGAASAGRDSMP